MNCWPSSSIFFELTLSCVFWSGHQNRHQRPYAVGMLQPFDDMCHFFYLRTVQNLTRQRKKLLLEFGLGRRVLARTLAILNVLLERPPVVHIDRYQTARETI